MKYRFLLYISALVILFTGCKDDFFNYDNNLIEEGIPTEVTLNFGVDVSPIMSRAAQESKYEYQVDNLYILAFYSDGKRMELDENSTFFTPSTGLHVTNGDANTPTKGDIKFTAKTANNAKIVGIANLTVQDVTSTAYAVSRETLDAITTLDELKKLVLQMADDESIERGGLFLMTGYALDGNGSNTINIFGNEQGTSTLDCTLKLERVDAKVEVKMNAVPKNSTWKSFSFEPKGWRTVSVPKQSLLVESEAADGDKDAAGNYFTTPVRVFEKIERVEVDNQSLYRGGSFVFYMPENRKAFRKEITNGSYALRDERDHSSLSGGGKPGQEYENGAFTYANANSTYMELTGHLSYTDENGHEVNADTRYTVHLGSVDGVNDYDTKRNGHYVYTITVQGINDIIVEVTEKNEKRPGHEGDVIYSSNKIFALDSHYDRCLLEIHPDLITDKMTWGVKTPFSSGIHIVGSEDFKGIEDYKWIKFAINAQYGYPHGQYVKYPGDQNYDDPDKEGDGVESPYYQTYKGGAYKDARMMDIHQLVKYLMDAKNKGTVNDLIPQGSDHICITAFVDENLYFVDPITGQTGADNRSLWKASVDKEDRQLHIITESASYSQDGNSSVVNSLYTFTQKAIRTVFDTSKESLTTAWGLESVMETERLPVGNVNVQGSSTRNGRANCLKWLEGKKWTEVMNTSEHYGLNKDFKNAAYACVLRNRDLNGDNIIEGFEIRWYLASIDQLTDIYLGEYALDEQSRLYPRNAADRPGGNSVYWHYTSSSYNSSDGAPWVLWAEEGASKGTYNNSSSSKYNGPNYSYRCVRNLGLSLDKPDEDPEDLVIWKSNGDGTYTIDMTNMSVKARRTNLETVPLPNHDETSANNRPYAKFVVHNQDRGYNGNLASYWVDWKNDYGFNNAEQWSYYQNTNVCPPGYRIPNQRELLIMASRLPAETWRLYSDSWGWYYHEDYALYMSQTSFSMVGKEPFDSERQGFMYRGRKTFYLRNDGSDTGFVRCVKDTN